MKFLAWLADTIRFIFGCGGKLDLAYEDRDDIAAKVDAWGYRSFEFFAKPGQKRTCNDPRNESGRASDSIGPFPQHPQQEESQGWALGP